MKKSQLYNPQQYISLLIFIIGVVLIFYILMLPPEIRTEILEQNRTHGNGDDDVKDEITVLMTQNPGTLRNIADDEIVEDLPSFNLFTRTDVEVIEEYDSLDVQKSLFDEIIRNITFKIENPTNTENIVLSFNTPMREGDLTIKLNGVVILSRNIDTASPSPLTLQNSLLKENNVLEFSVSGPGIEFWKSNKYTIENLKVTQGARNKGQGKERLKGQGS